MPMFDLKSSIAGDVNRPIRMMAPGDSNMAGINGIYTSLCVMVSARSGGKIQLAYNGGISGETAPQIAGRFHRDASGKKLDLIVAQIGTNSGNDSSIIIPALVDMISAAKTMFPNIVFVVCSTYPNTDVAASVGVANASAIKSFVAGLNDPRVLYAATFEALSTAGVWKAGYNADGKHASILGTRVAADAVLSVLTLYLANAKPIPPLKYSAANSASWLRNGTFSVGAPVGGVAASWTLNRGGGWTPSIDASDASIVGAAQVLSSGPSNTNSPYLSLDSSGFDWSVLAGKRIWVSFKVKHTYPADATPAFQFDAAPSILVAGTVRGSFQFSNIHASAHDVWHYFRYEYVVPSIPSAAVSNGINLVFPANASATENLIYRIAELDWGYTDEQQPAFPTVGSIAGSRTYDFPSLAAGASQTVTVSTPGAVMGDAAIASVHQPLQGTWLRAEVTANDVVTVTQTNPTGAAVDVTNAYLTAFVLKRPA